jgi:hypothetical protein|tara:strand:- start:949 stop:2052 length:1104 start_codon:yes stop_codon:yes gene_type:complete
MSFNVKEPYVFKTELCNLFYKYGADKCPAIRHSYSPEYYTLLKEYKSQFTDILEIGVGNDCQVRYSNQMLGSKIQISSDSISWVGEYIPGASLRAWRDFFTDANVYGIDIDKNVLFEEERIKCFYADQSKEEELENTIRDVEKYTNNKNQKFDLIVDDGSHIISHMILSFKILSKYMRTNGIYIIEDIKREDIDIFKNIELSVGIEIIKVYEGKDDQDGFVAYQRLDRPRKLRKRNNNRTMRKYLPTISELIDRLSIVQLKEVFIPEHKEEYAQEIKDIVHDLDELGLNGNMIRTTIVLAQMNLHIWHNETEYRKGEGDGNLGLTHGLNGIRNTAKNIIQDQVEDGGRKDYKVDCIAAEFEDWEVSW